MPLIYAIAALLNGAGVLLGGSSMFMETEIVRNYFSQRRVVQERPRLGEEAEALLREFQRQMDLQRNVETLERLLAPES